MSYAAWFKAHGEKHGRVVARLTQQGLKPEEIVAYFDFDNMVAAEPEFCELYAQKRKCHEMEKLNCYLCACPHFRFNDKGLGMENGKKRYSRCSIDSKDGATFEGDDALHHDCSGCSVPHHQSYVLKHFTPEWFEAMRDCDESEK